MNCEEFRDQLNRQFDGDPATDGLADHTRQCPECAALHRGARQLASVFGQLKPPAPPRYLTYWTLLALQDERRQQLALRLRFAACTLAASMMLAVMIPSFWPRANEVAVVPAVTTPAPTLPAETPPTLREAVNQASQAFGGMTARAADETVMQPLASLPVPTPRNDWDKPPQLEPSRPLRETGQSAAVALDPVTNSARRAFDMLFHELPPVDKTAKPDF